jgi:hypothetical protein
MNSRSMHSSRSTFVLWLNIVTRVLRPSHLYKNIKTESSLRDLNLRIVCVGEGVRRKDINLMCLQGFNFDTSWLRNTWNMKLDGHRFKRQVIHGHLFDSFFDLLKGDLGSGGSISEPMFRLIPFQGSVEWIQLFNPWTINRCQPEVLFIFIVFSQSIISYWYCVLS